MKGIMFNILENFVTENFDEESWEDVLDESKSDGVFVAPKTYDDSIFMGLVTNLIKMKSLVAEDALKLFGIYTFPVLAETGKDLIKDYKSPVEMLENLDGIIHVEVKKLMNGAEPPKFIAQRIDDDSLTLEYISKRNIPAVVEGLVEGLAKHFSQKVSISRESVAEGHYKFEIAFKR